MLHGMYQWCELVFVIHEGNKTFFFPKHCFIKALISIVISTHFPPYIMAWFLPRRWPNPTVFKKAWGQQTVGCETYKNSLGGRFWRIQVKANTIIEWMLWEFPHHFFLFIYSFLPQHHYHHSLNLVIPPLLIESTLFCDSCPSFFVASMRNHMVWLKRINRPTQADV